MTYILVCSGCCKCPAKEVGLPGAEGNGYGGHAYWWSTSACNAMFLYPPKEKFVWSKLRVVIWENTRGGILKCLLYTGIPTESIFKNHDAPTSRWANFGLRLTFWHCFFFVGIVISQLQHTQFSAQLEPWAQNGARKTFNIPPRQGSQITTLIWGW